MEITVILRTVISLVVIVNPLGAIPVFLSLTHDDTEAMRRRTAVRAAVATMIVLALAAIVGKFLLQLFGISLPGFRAAGGVLFVLMGVDMLNARTSRSRETPEEAEEAAVRDDISVVPMAIPELAGPGAIGSCILQMDNALSPHFKWTPMVALGLAILTVGLLSWLSLRMAGPIGKALGRTGINITTRVMGLLLTAVGVEFIVGGVQALWTARSL